mgnify:CR=1 FL=1
MARKALVVKHQKLMKLREKYYTLLQEARANGQPDPTPKRWKPCKWYNRCQLTGKTRSYMRDFGVSRQAFRKYAREWVIMWVRKASW